MFYQNLKEKAGARNISNQINKIFIDYFTKKDSVLGFMEQTDLTELSDHKDQLFMKYVIDSYAWIEYFMGTKTDEKVKPTIEGQEEKMGSF